MVSICSMMLSLNILYWRVGRFGFVVAHKPIRSLVPISVHPSLLQGIEKVPVLLSFTDCTTQAKEISRLCSVAVFLFVHTDVSSFA